MRWRAICERRFERVIGDRTGFVRDSGSDSDNERIPYSPISSASDSDSDSDSDDEPPAKRAKFASLRHIDSPKEMELKTAIEHSRA